MSTLEPFSRYNTEITTLAQFNRYNMKDNIDQLEKIECIFDKGERKHLHDDKESKEFRAGAGNIGRLLKGLKKFHTKINSFQQRGTFDITEYKVRLLKVIKGLETRIEASLVKTTPNKIELIKEFLRTKISIIIANLSIMVFNISANNPLSDSLYTSTNVYDKFLIETRIFIRNLHIELCNSKSNGTETSDKKLFDYYCGVIGTKNMTATAKVADGASSASTASAKVAATAPQSATFGYIIDNASDSDELKKIISGSPNLTIKCFLTTIIDSGFSHSLCNSKEEINRLNNDNNPYPKSKKKKNPSIARIPLLDVDYKLSVDENTFFHFKAEKKGKPEVLENSQPLILKFEIKIRGKQIVNIEEKFNVFSQCTKAFIVAKVTLENYDINSDNKLLLNNIFMKTLGDFCQELEAVLNGFAFFAMDQNSALRYMFLKKISLIHGWSNCKYGVGGFLSPSGFRGVDQNGNYLQFSNGYNFTKTCNGDNIKNKKHEGYLTFNEFKTLLVMLGYDIAHDFYNFPGRSVPTSKMYGHVTTDVRCYVTRKDVFLKIIQELYEKNIDPQYFPRTRSGPEPESEGSQGGAALQKIGGSDLCDVESKVTETGIVEIEAEDIPEVLDSLLERPSSESMRDVLVKVMQNDSDIDQYPDIEGKYLEDFFQGYIDNSDKHDDIKPVEISRNFGYVLREREGVRRYTFDARGFRDFILGTKKYRKTKKTKSKSKKSKSKRRKSKRRKSKRRKSKRSKSKRRKTTRKKKSRKTKKY